MGGGGGLEFVIFFTKNANLKEKLNVQVRSGQAQFMTILSFDLRVTLTFSLREKKCFKWHLFSKTTTVQNFEIHA